ncbi:MAG: hypothetical protein WCM76_16060, partial [Bacteroidota bacterium]
RAYASASFKLLPDNSDYFKQFDLSDGDNQKKVKLSLRHFTTTETTYNVIDEGLLITTGDYNYQLCFKNGIIELFRNKFETANLLNPVLHHIKLDDVFLIINSFLKGAVELHSKHFKTPEPFLIYITLINVQGCLLYSFTDRLLTFDPLPKPIIPFQPIEDNKYSDPLGRKIRETIISDIKQNFVWDTI